MATRQNLCVNPASGANVTGYGGGATPTRVTGLTGYPVTTGAQWTAGTFQQTPTGSASPGVAYTASMYVTSASFAQAGKTLYLAFTRSAGGDDFTANVSVNLPTPGTVYRVSITATAPALTTGAYLLLDAINASVSAVTITAVLVEAVGTLDTYFDGNTASAVWDGTANNSTSTLTVGGGTTTVTQTFDVRTAIASKVTQTYDVRAAISGSVTQTYDVRSAIGSKVTQTYDLRTAIGSAVTQTYDVRTNLLGRVTATFDVRTSIIGRVTQTFDIRTAIGTIIVSAPHPAQRGRANLLPQRATATLAAPRARYRGEHRATARLEL